MAKGKNKKTENKVKEQETPVNDLGELVLNEAEVELGTEEKVEVPVEPMQIKAPDVDVVEPKGVTKMEVVDDGVVAVKEETKKLPEETSEVPQLVTTPSEEQREKEQAKLTARMDTKTIQVGKVEDEENISIQIAKEKIDIHFDYILGKKGFKDKQTQLAQVVQFSDWLVALTKYKENDFFVIMDYFMSYLRDNLEETTPIKMLRFNIVTGKQHTRTISKANMFIEVCTRYAKNRKQESLSEQIDWGTVAAGRQNIEMELMKTYFRKYANS